VLKRRNLKSYGHVYVPIRRHTAVDQGQEGISQGKIYCTHRALAIEIWKRNVYWFHRNLIYKFTLQNRRMV